jgi:phage FluMu protein Com
MAMTKLTCPDCGTVLRPAKPVAPGKKVKCPRCELIFVAGADEDKDDRPRKPAAKKPAAKKAGSGVKEKPKKKEEEIYGYIKDPDLEDEDKKPQIDYVPDESIKDLRGPAIVILRKPATWLQFIGMAGALGWMVAFVILVIPTAFPIEQDAAEKEKEKQKQQRSNASAKPKDKEDAKVSNFKFFEAFDVNLGEIFLYIFVPMILLFVYSCVVTGGGIKMANLESRRFGIAASIMVMLPMHIFGAALVVFLLFRWFTWMFLDDPDFGALIGGVIGGAAYLLCIGVGGWCLSTLWNEEVIEGFEYQAE